MVAEKVGAGRELVFGRPLEELPCLHSTQPVVAPIRRHPTVPTRAALLDEAPPHKTLTLVSRPYIWPCTTSSQARTGRMSYHLTAQPWVLPFRYRWLP